MEESVMMMKKQNIFRDVNMELTGEDIAMLSPLQLAYVGDAVYELLIRTYLLNKDMSVNQLHRSATKYVKAKAQSETIHQIEGLLTEEEKRVVKRGRNSKTHTSPKNTDMIDYKYATGFEALIGYLYINKEYERISQIFDSIIHLKNE